MPFNDDPWHGVTPGTSPSMKEPNENEPIHISNRIHPGLWSQCLGPPHGPTREHAPPEKISTRPESFPWRSLREHMVTWLWDVRGLNVLRVLFPVKRFKLLGYDKSLWFFMLSIERRNKGDRGGAVSCGEVWWWSLQWFMLDPGY